MIPAVSPLIVLVVGVLVLAVWAVLLRRMGPRHRLGRLLATTPAVSVGEAVALADGPGRYVQVRGRIDSETDFEDDAHRPLVFRRTRLQLRRGSTWVDLDDRIERVPFEVREGLDSIAIDHEALADGLVVVVRESVGTARDAMDRMPAGTDPSVPVRLRVEQVSSVEHALVAGVPARDATGVARLTAGLGRPLVLATMDLPDALRVLAEGNRTTPVVLAGLLAGGVGLVVLALLWAAFEAVT